MTLLRAVAAIGIVVVVLALLGSASTPNRYDSSRRYERLRVLIDEGRWREANVEISEIMLLVAGRTNERWFSDQSVAAFPCADLAYIDLLLSEASGGRFGFAAQKAIVDRLRSRPAAAEPDQPGMLLSEDPAFLTAFGEAVGWRADDRWLTIEEMDFSPDASAGGLPVFVPDGALRAPFKSRKGFPERRASMIDLVDRRVDECRIPETGS
jgi:GUN4-like